VHVLSLLEQIKALALRPEQGRSLERYCRLVLASEQRCLDAFAGCANHMHGRDRPRHAFGAVHVCAGTLLRVCAGVYVLLASGVLISSERRRFRPSDAHRPLMGLYGLPTRCVSAHAAICGGVCAQTLMFVYCVRLTQTPLLPPHYTPQHIVHHTISFLPAGAVSMSPGGQSTSDGSRARRSLALYCPWAREDGPRASVCVRAVFLGGDV
jgi:hypothetical protein